MQSSELTTPIDILLVEDNPGDVRLTIEALKETKLENKLNVVKNGVEALSYLKREKGFEDASTPDLILLDLNIPKKNGHEVLSEIKSDPELMNIPVIVLTISKSEQDILKVWELKANDYLNKPLDLEQFIWAMKLIGDFWFSILEKREKAGRSALPI